MRRRALIAGGGTLLAGAPAGAPARAQVPRRARIGLLLPITEEYYAAAVESLRRGLAERGWIEPATLELLPRFSEGDGGRLPALARELVAAGVDAIITVTTPAIRAAQAATTTTPIVFAAVADAVESGLVSSLARPGGNTTGLTLLIPDLGAKQLELLGEIVPGFERVGVLRGRGEGANAFDTIRAAVNSRSVTGWFVELESPDAIAPAFASLSDVRCQAVILVDGPMVNGNDRRIVELAASHRLPMISTLRRYVDLGSLACYGPDVLAMWRRAGHMVDRILRGAKPAELPVEQPTAFQLIINLRTAHALGLALPPALIARADEVIE